jgi:hypothetical protein
MAIRMNLLIRCSCLHRELDEAQDLHSPVNALVTCELIKPSRLNVAQIEPREKDRSQLIVAVIKAHRFTFNPHRFIYHGLSHARVKGSVKENSLPEMLSYIYIYIYSTGL